MHLFSHIRRHVATTGIAERWDERFAPQCKTSCGSTQWQALCSNGLAKFTLLEVSYAVFTPLATKSGSATCRAADGQYANQVKATDKDGVWRMVRSFLP